MLLRHKIEAYNDANQCRSTLHSIDATLRHKIHAPEKRRYEHTALRFVITPRKLHGEKFPKTKTLNNTTFQMFNMLLTIQYRLKMNTKLAPVYWPYLFMCA